MTTAEIILGTASCKPELVNADEGVTVQLVNGDNIRVASTELRHVSQLREMVSTVLDCPGHAVVLLHEGCVLADDVCLSAQGGISDVIAVVDGGWEAVRLLHVATQVYEGTVAECGRISRRVPRTVLDNEWHVAGGSVGDCHWWIDEMRRTSPVLGKISEFTASMELLLEQCDSNAFPCWGGGSCFERCTCCGFCAAKSQACNRCDAMTATHTGMNKELAEAFRQLEAVVLDNVSGHPQDRYVFAYDLFQPQEKNNAACVPCRLRNALAQLSSLSCKLTRRASHNVWYLCLEGRSHPNNAFKQTCQCIPGFRWHGPRQIPHMEPGVELDEDAISNYSYDDFVDFGDLGDDHNAAEHPNAWRRWVRPWQREVDVNKSTYSRRRVAAKRVETIALRRYRRANRPRGGRHKEGEHASKHGVDRVVFERCH